MKISCVNLYVNMFLFKVIDRSNETEHKFFTVNGLVSILEPCLGDSQIILHE